MLHAVTSEMKRRDAGKPSSAAADMANRSTSRRSPLATGQSAYGNPAMLRYLSAASSLHGAPSGVLQRKCACGGSGVDCAECKKKEPELQRKAGSTAGPASAVPPIVHDVLRSSGRSLDHGTRKFMESRFGQDFSGVRVHTNTQAERSARAVDAVAYTVGPDIVFARNEYKPETSQGWHLLAHELAHVVQQASSPQRIPSSIGLRGDPQEHDAEQAASAVSKGSPVDVTARGDAALQRYSHSDCTENELKDHLWPGDYIARQMTEKAIRVLSAQPVPSSVTPLLTKYFMTPTPNLASILKVFDKIDVEYSDNDYIYECEEDCSGAKLGYTYGLWSHIHLCMNHLRDWSNTCIARTMVHEMSHYYSGTDDNGYCKSDCGFSSCPADLTADDALENADSYACLAYELYSMAV